MSDVTPVNGAHSPALHAATRLQATGTTRESGLVRSGDKVELSQAATFISSLLSKNDVRQDLVNRVRGEIAAGTYETSEKIDGAVDELLSDLAE